MYQQIADDLRRQIEAGRLEPGKQLPTELELREQYNASRNTIHDAIKRLMSLGLVETRLGIGTFVTQKIDPLVTVLSTPPEITEIDHESADSEGADPEGASYLSEVSRWHRRAEVSRPEVRVQAPSAEIANRLRRPAGAQVICRSQERYQRRGRALLGKHDGPQAGRLPGLDHGTRAGRQGAEVLRHLTRFHGL
jgi:GntR family transcriptional regulator